VNSDHMNAYQFCRDMYQHLRGRGLSPKFIAGFVARSQSALRRYMCEPGTVAAQKPPIEVTDRLVALVDLSTGERRVQTMDEARNQAHWIGIVNGEGVPAVILADIAGVDLRHLAWVGRSHPIYGIQPSEDQVRRAMATEALMQRSAA
jgi:hypothetical protein